MNQRLLFIAVIIVSLLISACARTRVTGVWKKNIVNQPPVRSLLVYAQPNQKQNRAFWESIISERFRRSGMDTVAAASLYPSDQTVNLLKVLDDAYSKGIEGVLVVREHGAYGVVSYHPPQVGMYVAPYWYPYGSPWYPPIYPNVYYEYRPGYTSRNHYIDVESFLYLTASSEQVWSMTTQTVNPMSVNALIGDVSRNVFKGLRRARLIQLSR